MLDYYFCEECQTYHHPNRVCEREISIEESQLIEMPAQPKITNFNIQISPTPTMSNFNRQYNTPGITFTYQNANTPKVAYVNAPIASPRSTAGNRPFMRIVKEEKQPTMNRIRYFSKRPLSPQIIVIPSRKVGLQFGRLREISLSPKISRVVSRSPVQQPTIVRAQNIQPIPAQLPVNIVTSKSIESMSNTASNLVIAQPPIPQSFPSRQTLINEVVQIPNRFSVLQSSQKIGIKPKSPRFTLERVTQTNEMDQQGFEYEEQKEKCCSKVFY